MADNVPELLFEITRQATGPLKLTYASRGAREVLGISPETLLENADMLFAGFPDEEREALENALLASTGAARTRRNATCSSTPSRRRATRPDWPGTVPSRMSANANACRKRAAAT